MGFRKKIVLTVPGVAILAAILIGLWSYSEIRENTFRQTYQYMEAVVSDVMRDQLQFRTDLLHNSHMDAVDFFVTEYQKEALRSIAEKGAVVDGEFLILNSSGELLHGADGINKSVSQPAWLAKLTDLNFEQGATVQGALAGDQSNHLYVGASFEQWEWLVFFLLDKKAAQAEVLSIFQRTFLGISLVMLCAVLFILFVLKRFIINRVVLLQEAALNISQRREIDSINIKTQDEFGDLARSMEEMAAALSHHERQQKQLQDEAESLNSRLAEANTELERFNQEFENQVNERTRSLENIHKELYENLESMKEELTNTKEKNNRLVKKLSELTLKQSDMVNYHSEVVKQLKSSHDHNIELKKQMGSI